jgi:predicted ATPase
MVKASLKKVFIKNFKSLHDCEIDIEKLNVVVGANASGKSNLIEAFRLLKKIYVEKDGFPFLEWWGYNNVVWQRKEELPIIIGLVFDIEGYDVYFETNFTGAGGKFQILREVLEIKGYVMFEKGGNKIAIKHDVNFIDIIIKNIHKYELSYDRTILTKEIRKLTKETKIEVDFEQRLLENENIRDVVYGSGKGWLTEKKTKNRYSLSRVWDRKSSDEKSIIICPTLEYKGESDSAELPLTKISVDTIISTLTKLLILYPLNIRLMKIPQALRREETLKEDGTNIASVYHTIYLKEGKIPEQIYNPLTMVFPKIDVRPHITDDGRVMIKFLEDGLELLPPNTSDGFYKILTLLTAIYLKPPLLIIDEIENSLHPSTLELILDTIGLGDTQAIITTHSPVVVDMTDLSNIILVDKEHGESKFKRIKDPEKIKEFLIKKGITFSEGWIYGDLFKTEQQA